MKSKIVIAGGSGFIGKYFKLRFEDEGYEVFIIGRKKGNDKNLIDWNETEKLKTALNEAELLINLAGKSVDCRYNDKNKAEIFSSRVNTTKRLGEIISLVEVPPKLWINSSTATIYRHAEDRPMTEEFGEIGTGFSVEVARAWERAFFEQKLEKTRQVALRIAIVLGKNGGVIIPFKNLVKCFLGGKQGNGNQMFSWIHIEDLFQTCLFILKNDKIEGILNCSSPKPITNNELMRTFRKVMKMPFGFNSPQFLLEIGARIIKTETELILKSRWVLPDRLEKLGFEWKFKTINACLEDILK
jgi:uncharacterized protein